MSPLSRSFLKRWLVCTLLALLSLAAVNNSSEAQTPVRKQQPVYRVAQNAADDPFPKALPAPSLEGGVKWLNTAGPLDLKDLRGKFVLLDFWTYCCINCMHILPELKKLEEKYPNEIVVIGVHSAKFDEEKDSDNIKEAILRHGIKHPVVNDANMALWQKFQVNSWPSLRVIDPRGRLIVGHSGEITFEVLDGFFKKTIEPYKKSGLLDETPLRFDLETKDPTPLKFPGKILADEDGGRLFISDSSHNRIVISSPDGKLLDVIGSGEIGDKDGDYATATFDHPQGMALHGETLYVADTENHMLRKVDLKNKKVETIAGTGVQRRTTWPGLKIGDRKPPKRFVDKNPRRSELNSPWALLIHEDDMYIAMAGPHQIWKMPLDESEIGIYAGNGREDIVDGPLMPEVPFGEGASSFAQPSGLATDGQWLYVADSEGSSVRAVPFDSKKDVRTVLGTSNLPNARLFTFGDVDGDLANARLQHVIGIAYDGFYLYVTDTYNNKVKRIDTRKNVIETIAGTGEPGSKDDPAEFDEPAGITAAAGKLYVADTNNHAIRVIDLKDGNKVSTLKIEGLEPVDKPTAETADTSLPGAKTQRVDTATLKPANGSVKLAVSLELPEGWKINPRAPMGYRLSSNAENSLVQQEALDKKTRLKSPAASFEVPLPLTAGEGREIINVAVTYYYCQEGDEGLCKVGSVVFNVPLVIDENGKESIASLKHKVE